MRALRFAVSIVGCLSSLVAAEGLNRFGGFVSAFDGADAPYYTAMLVVAIAGAGVLLLALFGVSNSVLKWTTLACLAISVVAMSYAPDVPVNRQIFLGLCIAAVSTLFIKPGSKSREST